MVSANKRLAKIDMSRVELFDLGQGERPMEAVPVSTMSGWPGEDAEWNRPYPRLVPPDHVSGLDPLTATAVELPFPSVLMATDKFLRFRPYRLYDGDLAFRNEVDRQLTSGKRRSRGMYAGFDHSLFRQRSVELGDVVQVVVKGGGDEFPGVFAVRVHMTEAGVSDWPDWPVFDLGSQLKGRADMAGIDIDLAALRPPFAIFVLDEAAALNFSRSFVPVLDQLGLDVSWDQLSPEMRQVYEPLARNGHRDWQPLHERVAT